MRPLTELPGTDEVVLPPRTRFIRVLLDGAILSGTALKGFPRRDLRETSASTGGEMARSLIGDTLRGGSGEALRGALVARPGIGFHCVALDGEGAT